ncbi:hypothetical protein E4191_17345 (plasmid) [Paracoccus liaowanqingii]|uniref:Uncharacterized protein n=1 Tax=Paracoccus liaowanqingii TaxID=2560053 RepID=A0A4Y5SR03_9RHOB|nr:hypothetical protein [Paracoccus liaowanqingii]QDA35911.1 hypothetical protein E4191_17345 [Paracoccus liaowanqingii]
MFEVGKEYEFIFLTYTDRGPTETGGRRWFVQAVEGTLLHLHSPASPPAAADQYLGPSHEQNMILNTASPFFHSARLMEEIDADKKRLADLAKRWLANNHRN